MHLCLTWGLVLMTFLAWVWALPFLSPIFLKYHCFRPPFMYLLCLLLNPPITLGSLVHLHFSFSFSPESHTEIVSYLLNEHSPTDMVKWSLPNLNPPSLLPKLCQLCCSTSWVSLGMQPKVLTTASEAPVTLALTALWPWHPHCCAHGSLCCSIPVSSAPLIVSHFPI